MTWIIYRLLIIAIIGLFIQACGENRSDSVTAPISLADTGQAKRPLEISRNDSQEKVLSFIRGERTRFDDSYIKEGSYEYISSYKGRVIRRASGANDQLLFDLKVSYMVDVLHMIELPGKRWLVCWQETVAEGLRSYAASYAMGTDVPLWKHTFPVPDAGTPLVKDDLVFVTARGLAACIETESGKIRWKLDTLYNPYNQAWQKLQKPVIKGSVLCLTDFPVIGRRLQVDTLWLDIATGQSVKRRQ